MTSLGLGRLPKVLSLKIYLNLPSQTNCESEVFFPNGGSAHLCWWQEEKVNWMHLSQDQEQIRDSAELFGKPTHTPAEGSTCGRICALHCKAATCYSSKKETTKKIKSWKQFKFDKCLKSKSQRLKTVKIQSWNLNYSFSNMTAFINALHRSEVAICSQTWDVPSLFGRFVPERLGSSAWRSPVTLGSGPTNPLLHFRMPFSRWMVCSHDPCEPVCIVYIDK